MLGKDRTACAAAAAGGTALDQKENIQQEATYKQRTIYNVSDADTNIHAHCTDRRGEERRRQEQQSAELEGKCGGKHQRHDLTNSECTSQKSDCSNKSLWQSPNLSWEKSRANFAFTLQARPLDPRLSRRPSCPHALSFPLLVLCSACRPPVKASR